MTAGERERHDALLLSEERLQALSAKERKSYLDKLYIHTLVGCDLIVALLKASPDAEQLAHLQSVYQRLSQRQEKLLELLEQG